MKQENGCEARSRAADSATESPASILRLILTPFCNLRCFYCHNEGFSRETDLPGRFEPARLKEWLELLRKHGVRSVALTGGEPLTHGNFADILGIVCAVFDRRPHLSTNGVLLGDHLDALAASCVERINVSCDAIDQSMYQQITGEPLLEKVVENVLGAVDQGFFVNVNCVALAGLNTDPEYIKAMLDFWSPKGVRLSFLRLCFSSLGRRQYFYDVNQLLELFADMGMVSRLVINPNRPPTLSYNYKGMDVAVRYYVPNRSLEPCSSCSQRQVCSEGLYHPRLGLDGSLRACILRNDLALDFSTNAVEEEALGRFLRMFDSVPNTWIPASGETP